MAEKKSRVTKVLFWDDKGNPIGEAASSQAPEDPFDSKYTRGLQEPPYKLEQLVFMAEMHPIHAAALEQKAADVVGMGGKFKALDESDSPEDEKKKLDEWMQSLIGGKDSLHDTLHELFYAMELDMETVGHGCVEVVRDAKGEVRHLYHVPAHTVRFHQTGTKMAQIRGQKTVWFKRWGAPIDDDVDVDMRTGVVKQNIPQDRKAHEMLVFKRPSRRSSWYGIPTYIAATGWITLGLAARDDNIMFFSNRREPRWAVILENIDPGDDLEEQLRRAFQVDMKQPHRNLLIPIEGEGRVTFQRLSSDRADGSFEKLSERADAAILVAHRMPPERLGITKVGPLGGNVVSAATRVYKEAVIAPTQAMISARMNSFIRKEYADDKELKWFWTFEELDIAEQSEDLRQSAQAFTSNLVTLNEGRAMIGKPPLMKKDEKGKETPDERGDQLYADVSKGAAGGGFDFGYGSGFGTAEQSPMPLEQTAEEARTDQLLEEIEASVRELIEKSG